MLFWSKQTKQIKEVGSAIAEISLIQARECSEWRFHGDSKLQSPILKAGCFWPLQVIIGV
jgi:hypothetical protein